MDENRIALLNDQLDALDRLFDRKATVAEVRDVTRAIARALGADPLLPLFDTALGALDAIVVANLPDPEARELALDATDDLRVALADATD